MNRRWWVLPALVVWLLASTAACAQWLPPRDALPYAADEVVITLKPTATEADLASLNALFGSVTKRKSLYMQNVYTLRLPGTGTTAGSTPVDTLLSSILANPAVAAAQRNYKYYPMDIPNDPLYPVWLDPMNPESVQGQWALQPDIVNSTRKHIYAQEAWDLEKGRDDVVVAVIDSGLRVTNGYEGGNLARIPHPDIGPRTYLAPDGITYLSEPGRIVDLRYCRDLTTGGTDPAPSDEPEDEGTARHGTHVAGIIAAKTDNQLGVASLGWQKIWILPLKVFADQGGFTSDDIIADAITYCIEYEDNTTVDGKILHADVINMSLGGPGYSQILRTAVSQAARAGIVIVASAGNSWELGPMPPGYPGAFDDVICVGATADDDIVTSFSQRGQAVDIAAPGEDVLSTIWLRSRVDQAAIDAGTPPGPTVPPIGNPRWEDSFDIYGNGYEPMSGTSMSSPMVAAAAALLRAVDVPAKDVRQILCETATPIGLGRPNDAYGWGLLNVQAALKKAVIDVEIRSPSAGGFVASIRPRFQIDFRRADPDKIRVEIDGVLVAGVPKAGEGPPAILNWRDYLSVLDEEAGKTTLIFDYTLSGAGIHKVKVTAESDWDFELPPSPPPSDSDEHVFRVAPRVLSQGWHLFSVPYFFNVPPKPEDYLGDPNLVLVRWHYASGPFGAYAFYCAAGDRLDPEATFDPPTVREKALAAPHDTSTGGLLPPGAPSTVGTPPTGVGYWLYVPNLDGYSLTEATGAVFSGQAYDLRLYAGWNMVGNPYPFPVQWANVVVEYAGSQVPITQAVSQGWISRYIFRYDSLYRRYLRYSIESALLMPWEAEWVNVRVRGPKGWDEPDLRLIIPGTPYTGPVW